MTLPFFLEISHGSAFLLTLGVLSLFTLLFLRRFTTMADSGWFIAIALAAGVAFFLGVVLLAVFSILRGCDTGRTLLLSVALGLVFLTLSQWIDISTAGWLFLLYGLAGSLTLLARRFQRQTNRPLP